MNIKTLVVARARAKHRYIREEFARLGLPVTRNLVAAMLLLDTFTIIHLQRIEGSRSNNEDRTDHARIR